MEWKNELTNILTKKENIVIPNSFSENRKMCESLLSDIINPTLDEIKSELEKHKRDVKFDFWKPCLNKNHDGIYFFYRSSVLVDFNEIDEYYCNIVCRIKLSEPENVYFHFEGNHKPQTKLDFSDISREKILSLFLNSYKD